MGGKIHVRSAEGVGTSFIFALDQRIIAKTSNEVEGLYSDELKIFDLTGKKVMVVDDNGVNLKVAKRLLKEYKLDVDLKQSGQECIDSIKLGEKYDLIMMDDFMPVMNGSQTLNNLKQIGGFDTPVIALTANNESSSKDKYMSLGFNGYLAKPIAKEELNKTLKEFLT
jgi:CheY-like chemotaxis protein